LPFGVFLFSDSFSSDGVSSSSSGKSSSGTSIMGSGFFGVDCIDFGLDLSWSVLSVWESLAMAVAIWAMRAGDKKSIWCGFFLED
jgi:hypothetical protein